MTDELLYAAAKEDAASTAKGERTRARILEVALSLFASRGYDKTTMRAIASQANVSLGNAYYYFRSKEHLIQAFYARSHQEHLLACEPILATETSLRARLQGVMEAKIETSMPYHRFAGLLFKNAADPQSPLNPFSEASRPVREQATDLMAEVVERGKTRIPKVIQGRLPELLWLYLMGIILFWVHDRSPECRRTHLLIDGTVGLVIRLMTLAGLPPMRPLVNQVMALLDSLGVDQADPSATIADQG